MALSDKREMILKIVTARHPRNSVLCREILVGTFPTKVGNMTSGDRIYTASGNEGIFIGCNPRAKKRSVVFETKTHDIFLADIAAIRTIIPAE